MKRTIGWTLLATLLAGSAGAARAESIRYIHQPLGDGRDAAFDFQNHTTQTPFVGQGGGVTIPRQFGSSLFAYKHGLDLTAVTLVAGTGVALVERIRVNGLKSNVFMPTAVPNVTARAGAIGYVVLPGRELRVGVRRTVELRYPLGDKNTFVVVVGCHPTGTETAAKLKGAAVGDSTLTANQETTLTVESDVPAMCGGQPMSVSVPPCFQVVNPVTSQLTRSVSLSWGESEAAVQTLTLKANSTCNEPNQAGEVLVRLSGVGLTPGQTRRPFVTWVPGLVLPKDRVPVPGRPAIPQLPPPQQKP